MDRLTGLPFVYALWLVRPGADAAALQALLEQAKEEGLRSLDAIAAEEARRLGVSKALCHEYLTRHVRYDLGPREWEGLLEFARRASGLDLVSPPPEDAAPLLAKNRRKPARGATTSG